MSEIGYTTNLDGVTPDRLKGFFVGWPHPPAPTRHLHLLQGSDYRVLAIDIDAGAVVGFITAISDGILSAYIPLLEVLPDYQGRGIGTTLVRQMLDILAPFPNVELLCDPELTPFYQRFGLQPVVGMVMRNRAAMRKLSEPAE